MLPNAEDSYSKTLQMDDGTTVDMDITDTAGQEEFR
jgi:GTPase SAR1 family protein